MNREIMTDTLKTIINTFGENDGIVKRIYLSGISTIIDGEIEDCLSVAIDIEENSLITFWQDQDDTYTDVEYFSSLTELLQNSIFNQVMSEYGTEFVE
jgi:hypothetical protein